MAELPKISTDRLILRAYLPEDADHLLMMWKDPDLSRYFPPEFKELNQSGIQARIAKLAALWQTRGYSQWGIFSQDNEQLIGYCGLQVLDKTNDVELYYGLTRNRWGQGLATEATSSAVQYSFERLDLPRLTALTFHQNTASQKVLQKLRFKFGGSRNFYQTEVLYFELSRQEYESGRK